MNNIGYINKLNNYVSYPDNALIHTLFEKQVKESPDNVAIIQGGKRITYQNLNIKANQIAHHLRNIGVKQNVIVGLYMEKTIEALICILGVLKAGGTYLPIDTIYPDERIKYMLNDSSCSVLITDKDCNLNHTCRYHITYNESFFKSEDTNNLSNLNSTNDIAYLMYTSGTTGNPKGVLIDHRNVVRLYFNDNDLFDFNSEDVWSLFHSLCFDLSAWEMYGALLFGGKLVVVPREIAKDTDSLINLLIDSNITVFTQTPSSFYNITHFSDSYDENSFDLRYIIFAGEKLEFYRLENWKNKFPLHKLINMYGITETTVHVTYKEVSINDIKNGGSNIGGPIPTLDTFIFSNKNELVENNEPGELFVGGLGLGRGYINKSVLTHEKFIDHEKYGRLYKSGDIVKMISEKEMEYIGRNDDQIKIRGFRIEKGEIAKRIQENDFVKDVLIDIEDKGDNKILNAYIIPDKDNYPAFYNILKQLPEIKANNNHILELENNMSICCINNYETNFMFNEIFQNNCYLKYGIKLGKNAVVFDVGANIGLFSLYIQNLHKDSTIYSFEPIPPIYEILKKNVELYNLNNKIFNIGLSDKNITEKFTYYPFATVLSGKFANAEEEFNTVHNHMSGYDQDQVSQEYLDDLINYRLSTEDYNVKLESLSNIIDKENVDKIDLLKIDVEKSELEVLRGINNNHWKLIKQLVIEVHDINSNLEKISTLLTEKGFTYIIDQDSDTNVSNLYNIYARSKNIENESSVKQNEIESNISTSKEFITNKQWFIKKVKKSLADRLPEYMIPQNFYFINKFPLTINGKTDIKSLRDNKSQIKDRHKEVSTSDVQLKLIRIWAKTLSIPESDISINDNFFELGGNSLLTTKLASRINKLFDKDIQVTMVFDYPTIKAMSNFITKDNNLNDKKISIKSKDLSTFNIKNKEPNNNDIAIIGMAARFPGADSVNEFWQNLIKGIESITFFGKGDTDSSNNKSEDVLVEAKGFLKDYNCFDYKFFNYPERIANMMDPQIRIFHEIVHLAFEDAGINYEQYKGLIGLFCCASANPLWESKVINECTTNLWEAGHYYNKDRMHTLISYNLNLKGPSLILDTACSSSLVAVDTAYNNLLTGSCDIAVAGGVSITFHDNKGYYYQEGMINSPDGHCRPFDSEANGTLGSNGVGVVVLRRLEDALKNNDHIYGVIKGLAVNNDGREKIGFTAPSSLGQTDVIKSALNRSNINPESISYIETHGTGTILGDPIEIKGLTNAFESTKTEFCAIGSVKSNFGHLDVVAGIAGLIKTALALKHKKLPPSINFKTPNPKLDLPNTPFFVNNSLSDWESEGPLRAGVSSFGIGGTNAHLILEEAPEKIVSSESQNYHLLTLSAKTETALKRNIDNLRKYLEKNPDSKLEDIAYTLMLGRVSFDHRLTIVCENRKNAIELLSQEKLKNKKKSQIEEVKHPIVFMFPGQGVQYINMCHDLYNSEPSFKNDINKCFEIIKQISGKNLEYIIFSTDSTLNSDELNKTETAQPALFAIEYALACLLIKWGIKPDILIGHSFGEYVAACISGIFTLEDALLLVIKRSELMKNASGKMLGISIPENELKQLLKKHKDISIATKNSTELFVVSGSNEAIISFKNELDQNRYACKILPNSAAHHSNLMDEVLEEFKDVVKQVKINPLKIPVYSNLTGKKISRNEILEPMYWINHLRKTVKFSESIEKILKSGNAIFLELGPGVELSTFVRSNIFRKKDHKVINLVKHKHDEKNDQYQLLTGIGQLWMNGVDINWKEFWQVKKVQKIPLPSYSFEKRRFNVDFLNDGTNTEVIKEHNHNKNYSFYTPTWSRSNKNIEIEECLDSPKTLLFINNDDFDQGFAKYLSERNQNPTIVKKGNSFRSINNNEFEINPSESKEYFLLADKLELMNSPSVLIVYFWNINSDNINGENEDIVLFNIIQLVQCFGNSNVQQSVELRLVTGNSYSIIEDEGINYWKSIIISAANTISKEYHNINCTCIDIDHLNNSDTISQYKSILRKIKSGDEQKTFAVRGKYLWEQSFSKVKLTNHKTTILRKKGRYLITGGMGGVGLLIAEYLLNKFQAHVFLLTRSDFPERMEWERIINSNSSSSHRDKIQMILEAEKKGGKAYIYKCDVADFDSLKYTFDTIESGNKRLDGIIHAAGVADGCIIQNRTIDSIKETTRPKIDGTKALFSLINKELDFFVIFSSISAYIYPFGQIAYSAASSFIDSFANYHFNKNGIKVISINWPVWKETGMALKAAENYNIEINYGLTNIEGIQAFESIINADYAQVAVSESDLNYLIQKPIEYVDNFMVKNDDQSIKPQNEFHISLNTNNIETELIKIVSKYVRNDKITLTDNFFDLGLTSLDFVNISRDIKYELNIKIEIVKLFKYPNLSLLSEYIRNMHSPDIQHDKKNTSVGKQRIIAQRKYRLSGLK